MFGDRPVASFMTIAVEKACESYSEVQKLGIFPVDLVEVDACKLKRDSYVDDIHTGGSQSDVNRMMGIKDINSGQYIGTKLHQFVFLLVSNMQMQVSPYLIM